MRAFIKILLSLSIFFMISCEDMFDYSSYVIDFSSEDKNVNERNIKKLKTGNDDTVSIAFTADTHRFYDEFAGFTQNVNNNRSIDFVIHMGDFADFGLPRQYLWANSFLQKLNIPYLVLTGNHDLVGNGFKSYKEMYGALDFSFIYFRIKFIFINTNSREFKFNGNVPDISWLNEQLKPANDFNRAVVLFHVPPSDADFDASLQEAFHTTLSLYDNVLFAAHGHIHHHEIYTPYSDRIPYVNVFGVEHRKYNLIKISNSQFDVKTVEF